jgi:hypothetical protein
MRNNNESKLCQQANQPAALKINALVVNVPVEAGPQFSL